MIYFFFKIQSYKKIEKNGNSKNKNKNHHYPCPWATMKFSWVVQILRWRERRRKKNELEQQTSGDVVTCATPPCRGH